MRVDWTPEETLRLIDMGGGEFTYEDAALALGRSLNSIKRKVGRLKISFGGKGSKSMGKPARAKEKQPLYWEPERIDDEAPVAALLAQGGFPAFEEDERGFLKPGWIYPKRQRLAA